MLYDATRIAKKLNISKVTAYAKMKLPEIQSFLISQNGKSLVDENGLEAIKQSLKYNQSPQEEVAATEMDTLKEDMTDNLISTIEFLKGQLNVKDEQMQSIRKLFENTQILFKKEQEKNVLALPEKIKEHDIELVNTLTEAMEIQRSKVRQEEEEENENRKRKGFFKKIFRR